MTALEFIKNCVSLRQIVEEINDSTQYEQSDLIEAYVEHCNEEDEGYGEEASRVLALETLKQFGADFDVKDYV